jgi:predicted dehydrogenase
MSKALRVGVVGVGHFGQHHARVLSELDDVQLVGVADIDSARAGAVAERHSCTAFTDYRAMIGEVDAVSVAVPTSHHSVVSCDFLERGVSVLVEKPMASTSADAIAIRDAAEKSGATLQVGHIMRFNPVVVAMRELDIEPKFLEVHRLSPFSFRSIDVGVVFDMMIHDIDLVLGLARGWLEKVDACAVAVMGKTEDICNARLAFSDGCVANITASRVALKTMRKVRIFAGDSYISMDFGEGSGLIIRKSERFLENGIDVEQMKALSLEELKAAMLNGFFTVQEMKLDIREPLKAELQSFVDCASNGKAPLVGAEDGIRAIEAAERILEAVEAHEWYR